VEGLSTAYSKLWGVVKLPAVVRLSGILVSCRLAFLCAESAASLKLIEKGVPKARPRSHAPLSMSTCMSNMHEPRETAVPLWR